LSAKEESLNKLAKIGVVSGFAVLAIGWQILPERLEQQPATAPGGALVDIVLPSGLSDKERLGENAFNEKCAACHGINAVGQDGVAPPLVHVIYEPSHHGDEAFHRAVANGVQAHHWPFGNMPPIDGLTKADVDAVIAYIRALQRANDIY
jgi:mono/diheme cytochrome c family protein